MRRASRVLAIGFGLACATSATATFQPVSFADGRLNASVALALVPVPPHRAQVFAQNASDATIVDQLHARAYALMEQGHYREALPNLDAILRALPEDAKALNDRGLARWRALGLRSTSNDDRDGFAVLQREMCREAHGSCEDVALALADLDRAIDLTSGPDRAIALVNRAEIFSDRSEGPRALADYDEAVRLRPDEPSYRVLRAGMRRQTGDAAGARADLDEALRLTPHDRQALVQRAGMLQQSGDLDGARADLDDALRQPMTGETSDWVEKAHDLRLTLSRPDDPGMEAELKNLSISAVGLTKDLIGHDAVSVGLDAEATRRFADFHHHAHGQAGAGAAGRHGPGGTSDPFPHPGRLADDLGCLLAREGPGARGAARRGGRHHDGSDHTIAGLASNHPRSSEPQLTNVAKPSADTLSTCRR